ncbi:Coiled-coil domain-containing protein 47 [Polyrhizophydium stewartii]|uniref:Coiled-coil domain-containing protein 47 n=1 Tax=Polyrhizophydium stewartii TaxID=2732419 RepID=A0ABR4NEF1_9FUNG
MPRALDSLLLALCAGAFAAVRVAADWDDTDDADELSHGFTGQEAAAGQFAINGETKDPIAAAAAAANAPRSRLSFADASLSDFWFEAIMIVLAVVYFISYTYGKRANRELARKWMHLTLGSWDAQFAHIGSNEGHKLIRDGPRDYIFYASGRLYVAHVYGNVRLVARHDFVQRSIDFLAGKDQYDRVSLKATLNDKIADPFIFAILPRKNADSIIKNRWDLRDFPKARDLPGFPKSEYTLLTDAPEFAAMVWDDPKFRKAIFASLGLDESGKGSPLDEPLIDEIILTDLPKTKPTSTAQLSVPRTLTVSYRLPTTLATDEAEASRVIQVTETLFDIIDYLGQHGSLSLDGKSKVNKLRAAAEEAVLRSEEAARKEELAKKKATEKKAKEEQVALMSPEEQRKYEEKERKREMKKQQSKMMKRGKM